jgi:hypothetical protein
VTYAEMGTLEECVDRGEVLVRGLATGETSRSIWTLSDWRDVAMYAADQCGLSGAEQRRLAVDLDDAAEGGW